jgi:primosomal protein N'
MICKVLVFSSRLIELSYAVPLTLLDSISIGSEVAINVNDRTTKGVVVGFEDELPGFEVKEIISVTIQHPLFGQDGLDTSLIADALSFSTAGTHLANHLWNPPSPKLERVVEITNSWPQGLSPSELELFEVISEMDKPTIGKLSKKHGKNKTDYALHGLIKKGVVKVVEKITFATLPRLPSHFVASDYAPDILKLHAKNNSTYVGLARDCGVTVGKLKKFEQQGFLRLEQDKPVTTPELPFPGFEVENLSGLTFDDRCNLYIEKWQKYSLEGHSMIILSATSDSCKNLFDKLAKTEKNIFLATSDGTPANDAGLWEAVKSKANCLVVGIREAIFLPLRNLAEIIVDEPLSPMMDADEPYSLRIQALAKIRSNQSLCRLTLCGFPATLDGFIQTGIVPKPPSKIEIINMLFQTGAYYQPLVSEGLVSAIKNEIIECRPSVIIIARKGYSNFVFCDECGSVLSCPVCQIPLTYHHASHSVSCRFCKFVDKAPNSCPSCGGVSVIFKAGGSERLHLELEQRLPECRILRADSTVKNAYQNIRSFGKPGDVLIGTTMVLEKADFRNVKTIALASVDGLLSMPIFSASHKAYSLLSILSSKVPDGKVIVQTYMPQHPFIKALSAKELEEFLKNEVKDREDAFYPPFSQILYFTIIGKDKVLSKKSADTVFSELENIDGDFVLSGPNAGYFHRLKGEYRWDILLKSKELTLVLPALLDVVSKMKSIGVEIEVVNPNT